MKKFICGLLLAVGILSVSSLAINASGENIISGGSFEGFISEGSEKLDFTDPAFNDGVMAGYGSGNWDSRAIAVKDPKNSNNTVCMLSYTVEGKPFSSFFKFATIKPGVKYTIDLDYYVEGETDNFGLRFAGAPTLEKTFYAGGATDGWKHASWEWTTDKDGSYDSINVWFNTKSNLNNKGYVDNIVIKEVEATTPEPGPDPKPEPEPVTPVSPLDPNKEYYFSDSLTINGDFEKFSVGTVFSEEQLEGAWGSVGLDNPAVISEVDGSHVLELKKGPKVYSSAFLMMPPELETGDLLRLSYDIKLVLANPNESYKAIDSSLVGGANISYYLIDYRSIDFNGENHTTGNEVAHYPIIIKPLENGWYRITLDYKLTRKDLVQTNSLRFLFTAMDPNDHMYIDNVNLYEISETPFVKDIEVESITINDGVSLELFVGDEKKLSYTVNPADATNKNVSFITSDKNICTVDASGNIVAKAKGACTITIKAENGVSSEIAIVVKEKEKPKKKGCGGSVMASITSIVLLAGGVFVLSRKKRR